MNLIFITIDGARVDRIIHGNFYKKLIDKSAFFSKTITYAPYTIGAMHAIFSGTYGNKSGVDSYWSTSNFKKNQYKTLVKYLHDTEYTTIGDSINKLILPKDGFDELTIHDEVNDDLTQRHLLLLSNAEKLKSDGKKFFLYLHYSNIHTGIMQQVLKKYDNFSKEYFSNKNENAKFYDTLFKNADKYLETVITECEKLCLTDDTLIVVISDHGISIGEKIGERAYGSFCYDYTIKTFANYCSPDLPSSEFNDQVSHVDFMPTILADLKISQNKNFEELDGKSLLNAMKGEKYEERYAYTETANPLNERAPPKQPNTKSIRSSNWKLIFNEHNNSKELYNLHEDPNEIKNLIDEDIEIKNILWENLKKFQEVRTQDDLAIPLSKRGLVNP